MKDNKQSYITTFNPIGGWNSVLMVFDDECGCHIPEQTGFNNTMGSGKKEDAIKEAKFWAECEGIKYIGYGEAKENG
jgi:hypothetical protein